MEISFFVPGKAAPGGSKKGFYNRKLGRVMIVDACKDSAPWKQQVSYYAMQSYKENPLLVPLLVDVIFHIGRPRSHFGSGKNKSVLKKSAPQYPLSKPDTTKLWRSTEDALTGIIWKDDAQVVTQIIRKVYSEKPGVEINISTCLLT